MSRADVAVRLNALSSSGPVAANRARATLSALFAWAIGEGITDTNPVIGTNKPTEEVARERVLSDVELIKIWEAVTIRDTNQFGAIVRLLILTGQRRGEVAGMRRSEIDLERATWTIPSERTKNHRAHVVPLSEPTLAILRCVTNSVTDNIFSPTHWSHRKAQLDAQISKSSGRGINMREDHASGMSSWCLHDLRRTAATRMGDLGVQPHIVEAVLNHASGHKAGVAGIYNRAAYDSEKRTALTMWAERMLSLVEGRERVVVPLRAG